MIVSDGSIRRIDPFLRAPATRSDRPILARRNRPIGIQTIVNTMRDMLRSSETSSAAHSTGAKIIDALRTSTLVAAPKPWTDGQPLPDDFQRTLHRLNAYGPSWLALSKHIQKLAKRLDWYRGRTGEFGSVNFKHGHAHAILAGPDGIEVRSDLRLGLSLMAPYTRFPDHTESHPRLVFPLSGGEFRSGSGEWVGADVGSVLFYQAGEHFAGRCTRDPMLLLRAQHLRH